MNVIYASDNGYAWLMGISMLSLFENNKECKEINVYLFGDKISKDNEVKLNSIADKYGRNFSLIDVNDLELPEKLYSGRYPKSAFSRIFAYKLLPESIDKVLYLDCDLIINGEIEELYDMDFAGNTLMAAMDPVSVVYNKKIGIRNSDVYINTGVMLMNLTKMRNNPKIVEMSEFVNRYSKAMDYADQEIINGIYQGEIGYIPVKFNMMTQAYQYSYKELMRIRHPHHYYTEKEVEEAKKDPRIFHYTTCMMDIRPWFANSKLRHAPVFDKYWRMSPWADVNKKEMDFSASKYKIMKFCSIFPASINQFLLGMLHAYIKPWVSIIKN